MFSKFKQNICLVSVYILVAVFLFPGCYPSNNENDTAGITINDKSVDQAMSAGGAGSGEVILLQGVDDYSMDIGTLTSDNQFNYKNSFRFEDQLTPHWPGAIMVNKNRRIVISNGAYYYSGLINTNFSTTWQQYRQENLKPNFKAWALNANGRIIAANSGLSGDQPIKIAFGNIQADGSIAWIDEIEWYDKKATDTNLKAIALNDNDQFILTFSDLIKESGKWWTKLKFLSGNISNNTLTLTGGGAIRKYNGNCALSLYSFVSLANNGMVVEYEQFRGGDTKHYLRVGTTSGNNWNNLSLTSINSNGKGDYPVNLSVNYTTSPYYRVKMSYWGEGSKKIVSYGVFVDPSSGQEIYDSSYIMQEEVYSFPGSLNMIIPNTWYKIVSRQDPTLVLDADIGSGPVRDGSNVQLWAYIGGMNQQWQVVDNGNGYCHIVSRANPAIGFDADVTPGPAHDGTNVRLWTWENFANRNWQIIFDSNGFCKIVSQADPVFGLDADISDGTLRNGTNVQLWTYFGNQNQDWDLVAVP